MTDFDTKLRKMCRNPKCRMRLPQPVANELEGFCTRGCYKSFFLHRCRVCEKTLEDKYRKKKAGELVKFVKVRNPGPTCGDTGCKRRWRDKEGTGRFSMPKDGPATLVANSADLCSETAAAQRVLSDIQQPKAAKWCWRIIAGPELTPDQLHCATVPDGQIVAGNPTWEDGQYERIEVKNRRALEEHFDKLDAEAVANDFCAACGRTDNLGVTLCHDCHDEQLSPVGKPRPILRPEHRNRDDLSIPAFLRRDTPQADLKLAA